MPLNKSFSLRPANCNPNIEVVHMGKNSNHVGPIVIFWERFNLCKVSVFVRHAANSIMHDVHCTYNTFHNGFKSKNFYLVQQYTNETVVQLVPE